MIVAFAAFAALAGGPAGASQKGGTVTQTSAKGYRYVSVADTISDNTQDGNEAICPGDEPVVSGGAYAPAAYGRRVEINTSRPYDDDADGKLDDGWIAYVDNLNSSDPTDSEYLVYAICDKRAAEKDYRYKATASVPVPEGSQVGVAADCPDDEPAVGGGVSSSGFLNDEMALNTARPFDDGDAGNRMDDGWSIYVDNNNVGNAGQFMVGYVVCDKARAPGSYIYRGSSVSVDDGTQSIAGSVCPGATRLAGGGLRSSGAYTQRMFAVANYPSDDGGSTAPETWHAGVNNATGGGSFQSVTAYAVCRK